MAQTQLNVGYQTIVPDGLALYRIKGKTQMIVFEQHNGKDIKRAMKQMLQHCDHLESKILKHQYQLSEAPTV